MATVGNKQFDAKIGSGLNKVETMSTWSREEKHLSINQERPGQVIHILVVQWPFMIKHRLACQ
ncbi:hypothetical protein LguiA_029852 [Lonicera macranthoides]